MSAIIWHSISTCCIYNLSKSYQQLIWASVETWNLTTLDTAEQPPSSALTQHMSPSLPCIPLWPTPEAGYHTKAALNIYMWDSLTSVTFGNVTSAYFPCPGSESSGFPQLQARERDVHSCPANEICSPPFLLESCPIFWQMGKTTFFSCMLLSKSNHFGGFVIVWATLGMATVIRILEYLNGH